MNEDDPYLARSYFYKIGDQDILYEIFAKSNQKNIKHEAIRYFKDQQLLYEIAINDKDPSTRQSAVYQLKDEKLLLKVYNNEIDSSVRESIADNSSLNPSDAIKIAKDDPDFKVREKTVINLKYNHKEESQELCCEIAQNKKEELSLRKLVIENLDEQKYGESLFLIVRSTEHSSLRIAAIENLLKNKSKRINKVLEDIAINDPDIEVKNFAYQKLHYEEGMLAKLRSLCVAYTKGDKKGISILETEAIAIGKELNNKGGIEEMRRIYYKIGGIPGQRTLEMLWDGIGQWQG